MRAPVHPIGCPRATAPPFTLTFASAAPLPSKSILVAWTATAAKASLISTRSRSFGARPTFFRADWIAIAGTVCNEGYRSEDMP